jgi:hypothetical protein
MPAVMSAPANAASLKFLIPKADILGESIPPHHMVHSCFVLTRIRHQLEGDSSQGFRQRSSGSGKKVAGG